MLLSRRLARGNLPSCLSCWTILEGMVCVHWYDTRECYFWVIRAILLVVVVSVEQKRNQIGRPVYNECPVQSQALSVSIQSQPIYPVASLVVASCFASWPGNRQSKIQSPSLSPPTAFFLRQRNAAVMPEKKNRILHHRQHHSPQSQEDGRGEHTRGQYKAPKSPSSPNRSPSTPQSSSHTQPSPRHHPACCSAAS